MTLRLSITAFAAVIALVGLEAGQGLYQARVRNVSGVVVDSDKKPLQHIHVYLRQGEEEDITNSRGEFTIRTYQEGPLTLYFRHPSFRDHAVEVKSSSDKIKVMVQRR